MLILEYAPIPSELLDGFRKIALHSRAFEAPRCDEAQ